MNTKKYLYTYLKTAQQAISSGAYELGYLINYEALKKGKIHQVKEEVLSCTRLGLLYNIIVKFSIEVAALTNEEIVKISTLIKNVIVANFGEKNYHNVFAKSSTGFYKTKEGLPNGATIPAIILMLENSNLLPLKALEEFIHYP